MKLIMIVMAMILSTGAIAAGNGNSDSGDGGSVVVERMIAANEAAMERYVED
jgi:hypothetical protein